MKMFRRIFALTMVIAMVCLFSASAFAASSFRDHQFYDGETILDVFADINMISTNAGMGVEAVGLSDCNLAINCIYDYKDHYNQPGSDVVLGINPVGSNSCGVVVSTTIYPSIREFTKAVYAFDASITAFSGTYNYNPASVTLTP